ncbi:MAG: hypothetical protein M3R36_15015 [Bacteroidota bacterium]|nr:hypothetical protein [Bacteroidota bacterium]
MYQEIEKIDKYIDSIKLGREHFSNKFIAENNKSEYWSAIQGRQDKGVEARVRITEYLLLNLMVDLSLSVSGLQINLMYNEVRKQTMPSGLSKVLILKSL